MQSRTLIRYRKYPERHEKVLTTITMVLLMSITANILFYAKLRECRLSCGNQSAGAR